MPNKAKKKPSRRRGWPPKVETTILLACRRRCAICVGLDGDWDWKPGQLAHIDRNASNNTEANAAYLCLLHHDLYDSVPRQTKRHTPDELRAYQLMVVTEMAKTDRLPASRTKPRRVRRKRFIVVSLDVYERRLPTYNATITFLRAVCRGDELKMEELWAFAGATEQALYLFDEVVADYLSGLFRKAALLRANYLNLQRPENWKPGAHEENMDLLLWFTQQFDEMRVVFTAYLRIAPTSIKDR